MANGFTGKIIYPVVNMSDSQIDIRYRVGARTVLNNGENVALAMEAHERTNGSYDIWVKGRLVSNTRGIDDATRTMSSYIDSKTGSLRDSRLEEIAKK